MSDFNLVNIAAGVWETIYQMFTGIANNVINNLASSFGFLIPSFNHLLGIVAQLFQLVLPATVYCFDAMLISGGTIMLIVTVLIFKITAKFTVWWFKIVLEWWHQIAP